MSAKVSLPQRRRPSELLPEIKACMTKNSLENFRARIFFNLEFYDNRHVRRQKLPIHECFILEMKEGRYDAAANLLQDIIYENVQILRDDDIGFVVDIRKRLDYLRVLCKNLILAEKAKENRLIKNECLIFLNVAMYFMKKEKGIWWLADKFFTISIAISSKYVIDGGRLKARCKYFFGKFLADKFSGAVDLNTLRNIFTSVRDAAIGKPWLLYDEKEDKLKDFEQVDSDEDEEIISDDVDLVKTSFVSPHVTISYVTSLELYKILINESKALRKKNPIKAEGLARLAEKRALDAGDDEKVAEAILEIGVCQVLMNNLSNAQRTFLRGLYIFIKKNDIGGICQSRLHLADVMQRIGEYEASSDLLVNVGELALKFSLRRYLGAALHLLGELHLRAGTPELGTPYFTEAFLCFQGFRLHNTPRPDLSDIAFSTSKASSDIEECTENTLYKSYCTDTVRYEQQAEQSRVMAAVSFGQELMKSYFDLMQESVTCTVARVQCIEWKLCNIGWWVERNRHDIIPCLCSNHKRTGLDAVRLRQSLSASETYWPPVPRQSEIQDIMKVRSSRLLLNTP